jgi:hypothetical protein
MKWLPYAGAGLVVAYGMLFTVVLSAMLAGPERFGQFMRRMPGALVWGALHSGAFLPLRGSCDSRLRRLAARDRFHHGLPD